MSANKLLYSLLPLLVSLYVQMCYFSVQQHGHMHSSTWRGEHVTYRNMANESANYRNLGPMVTSLEGESYIQVVCSHCFDLRARARNIYAFYLLTRWGCVSVSHGYGKIYQWWDYRSFPCPWIYCRVCWDMHLPIELQGTNILEEILRCLFSCIWDGRWHCRCKWNILKDERINWDKINAKYESDTIGP